MQYDIIVTGIGGQGVLFISNIIAAAAVNEDFFVKQSEIRGMAQRGASVISHLRISNDPIRSDIIPRGHSSMIISTEPLEGLRYIDYLLPTKGILISAITPVKNILDYPNMETIFGFVKKIPHVFVAARKIALEAGRLKNMNIVLIGRSAKELPIKPKSIENVIKKMLKKKDVRESALKAFQLGLNLF